MPLIWVGLGLLVGVSWVLVSFDLLLPVLPRVIFLFASLLLLGGLVWLTVITTKMLVNKSRELRREDSKQFVHWPTFLFLEVPVVVVLFVTGTFVADWWIGASIRASDTWSFLPPGNLFAGGKMGWTYVILVAALVAGLMMKKRTDDSGVPLKRQRTPRQQRSSRKPKAKVVDHDVDHGSSVEEMQNLFQTDG